MRPDSRRFLAGVRRELHRGVLPIWILEELDGAPRYGYELLQRLRARTDVSLPVGPSSLYPSLRRLRAAGLVRVFHGTISRGPLRKYYELTDAGRALLPELQLLRSSARQDSAEPSVRRMARPEGAAS